MATTLPFGCVEGDGQRLGLKTRLMGGRVELTREEPRHYLGRQFRALDLEDARTLLVTVVEPAPQWLERINPEDYTLPERSPLYPFTLHQLAGVQPLLSFGFYEADGYTVHSYEKFPSLARTLERRTLPSNQLLRLLTSMARLVKELHDHGMVIGALCPLCFGYEEASGLNLIETGLTTLRYQVLRSLGREQGFVGIDDYLSPEAVFQENVTAQSDVFSLGILFYEILTGKHPYRTSTVPKTQQAILNRQPAALREVVPTLPQALHELVGTMLQKDPDRRPRSAAEVVASLLRLQPNTAPDPRRQPGADLPLAGQTMHISASQRRGLTVPKPSALNAKSTHSLDLSNVDDGQLTAISPRSYGDVETDLTLREACRLLRREDTVGALQLYAEEVGRNPENMDCWLGIGLCLVSLQRWDELETHLREGMRQFPRRTDLRAVQVFLLEGRGNSEQAEVLASQLLDQNDPSEFPWLVHAMIMLPKDREVAARSLRQAMQRRPKDWWMFYKMGVRALEVREPGLAYQVLQRALGLNKDFYLIPYLLGVAAVEVGERARAKRYFQICLNLAPDFGSCLEELAALEGAK